jgi:hypothetical protein
MPPNATYRTHITIWSAIARHGLAIAILPRLAGYALGAASALAGRGHCGVRACVHVPVRATTGAVRCRVENVWWTDGRGQVVGF